MSSSRRLAIASLGLGMGALAQYTATYSPTDMPDETQQGQYGTNDCGTTSSQSSNCQNAFINSVDDFCLWGPPASTSQYGPPLIGNVEEIVVSYCLKDGYGTRIIPSGTIQGAHFVKVMSDEVSYVQVTGYGDMTQMGLVAGDEGGELDPHSWTGLGNPQGGVVFTNAFTGAWEQTHEWTSFMSANDFCFRACRDGPNAAGWCQHIYDVLSCDFTIPGSMDSGFDNCDGDPSEEPGVYSGSTFSQGDPTTPAPHPPGATSQCTPFSTIGGGTANLAAVATTTMTTNSSAAASTTASNSSSAMSSSAAMNTTTSTSATITSAPMSSTTRASSSASASASASASQAGGADLSVRSIGLGGIALAVLGGAVVLL